jgi:hypothetical protein
MLKKFNYELDSINKTKVMAVEHEMKIKAKQNLLEERRKQKEAETKAKNDAIQEKLRQYSEQKMRLEE